MIEQQKSLVQDWFKALRDQICKAFEVLETRYCQTCGYSDAGQFSYQSWERSNGGGGVMAVMRGKVFEKVGVNISTVWGEFSPKFRAEIPGATDDPRFWASGISLVAHMNSPLVPAVHMNTRHIITTRSWFGGGTDLTPYYPYDEDTRDFHDTLRQVCDSFDNAYYPKYKKWCDEYFFLPHRNEARGVGGIFYDYLDSGSWERDFSFTQSVGRAFLEVYQRIILRRFQLSWTKEQRAYQLHKRGRYVEFNLLYDRGTRFGLMTEGNMDAIFMSMPPEVRWS